MAGDDRTEYGESGSEETESSVKVLRSGREEARIVLDHQLRMLSDMHTEAFRTVRLTVLILGLLISVMTLPETGRIVNGFTIAGGGSLLLAVLSGLGVYSVSNPMLGVGTEYLRDLQSAPYRESEWFELLLCGYREWIETVEKSNHSNAVALGVTRLLLGTGIVLIAVGFGVGLFF